MPGRNVPRTFETKVYREPVADIRRVDWFTVVATSNESISVPATARSEPLPATVATIEGMVIAAADGTAAETDWASTSTNPMLRRASPETGERSSTPVTSGGSEIARSSAVTTQLRSGGFSWWRQPVAAVGRRCFGRVISK